jgi:hypothetical protein
MPPDEAAAAAEPEEDVLAGEVPETVRSGLPDWLWAMLLTGAILATLVVIGRSTFVA